MNVQEPNDHPQPFSDGGDAGFPEAVEDSVVHFKQSHNLVVDLSTFSGDATLIVLPYDRMTPGDEVWVDFASADPMRETVTETNVNRVLQFQLPRAELEKVKGETASLKFAVVAGIERNSKTQTFTILEQDSAPSPRLGPIRIEGANKDEIQPVPGGVQAYIKKPDEMQTNDELLLFVNTKNHDPLPDWLRLDESQEGEDEFTFLINQALLELNLNECIQLWYQFAGPGRGLSSEVLELKVTEYNPKDASVVHFKQSHDRHIDTTQFRTDGVLLVPPYDDMAADDHVVVYWTLDDPKLQPMMTMEHTVTPEEVGFPLKFSLARTEFPGERSATTHFCVTPKGGTERTFRQQHLTIAAGAGASKPRLPEARIEGEDASDLIVVPDPQGKVVLVPAYPNIKLADEVYFHADGRGPTAPQFKRIDMDDLGSKDLKFKISGELLRANTGDYLEMFYQFGRQGLALSSEKRRVTVKQFQDAIEISHVLFQQAHDRVVELDAFKGSATLVVLPFQGMAEAQVVKMVWSVDEGETFYPHTISKEDVGSPIRFSIPRAVLEAGKNKQVSLRYTVEAGGALPVGSQSSNFRILEQATSLPDRLPEPSGLSEPLPPDKPVLLTVKSMLMAEGDELVCYAEGAYPLIQSHRVNADDVTAGNIEFILPVIWLQDNAGWPITLSYQFARKQQLLSSEILEVQVVEQLLGGYPLVHIDQAHDRVIDLAVHSKHATLITRQYEDIQVLDDLQVVSRGEDGKERPGLSPSHRVQAEDIGGPILFTLKRDHLLAAQGQLLRLHLRRHRKNVAPRDYPSQVFKVVHDAPSKVEKLGPVRVDGQIATQLPARPGGLEVTIALDQTHAKERDDVLLLVSSETTTLVLDKSIERGDLDDQEVVMIIPETFLEPHLGQTVTLSYQIARQGRALSAKALQARVYRAPVRLDGVLVHFKHAHGMVVDLGTFSGPGILTLLPYPDRARGDKLTVSWGNKTLPAIDVDTDDATLPLMTEVPREMLEDVIGADPTQLFLTISRDDSPDRMTAPQLLTVQEQNPNPLPYLEPPQLETPLQGVIYPLPQGIEVTLPGYEGMAVDDEVLFHPYLVEMTAPQWKKLIHADVQKGTLTFTLGKALLDSSVGKTLSLRYQYGRKDEALNSRVLQLDVLQHPAAIETSRVHVKQSHALVIETDSFSDNALLVIPEYQGKAEGDQLTISWARLDQLATPFNITHIVDKDDLGVTITKLLNKATLDEALNIGAQLTFSVKPVSGSEQRSAVQTFEVLEKADSPPPHLDAPQIAGVVDGKLEPVIEGAKVTIYLTNDFTRGTDVFLHMNGKASVRPLAKKLSATDLSAGKLEFRLAGYWLLANAGAKVEVFYQYARHGEALSSAPLSLQILESEDPTLPGTVVHAKQSHDQLIDLHAFKNDAMVYVLPHSGMNKDDTLIVYWQGFDGQESITEEFSLSVPVSELDETPFEFQLPRTLLEPLSGFAIHTYYTFGTEGEEPFVSAKQTFLIVDNDPSPKPLLPAPAVEGESGGLVYPSPEGAWVTIPAPEGQLEEDESLLFADGATSIVAWWAGKPDKSERIHLTEEFLLQNIGERVTLSYQFARPRMALASHEFTFTVAEKQTLPPLSLQGSKSEVFAVDLRTGGRFVIAGAAPLLKGTVTVYVQNTATVPAKTLLTITCWTRENDDFHFAFDRSKSAMLLGKTLKCFYTHVDPVGLSANSDVIELTVEPLSLDSLPYLECESAIGRSELSKARAGNELIFNVHGWPFMAANQRFTISAIAESGYSMVLHEGYVTDDQAKALSVQAKFDSDAFFMIFGISGTVRFCVEIKLAEETLVKLRNIELRIVA
ncbi:hypothetical protein [Pseudomonas sp. xss_2]|uniref:hypothetical protein n=1 Tax=Pseudomonas sp. xss_2 TaxID=3367215 RepID=UPI00370C3AF4